MEPHMLDLVNTRKIYRKMLNLYWAAIVLTIALEYVIYYIDYNTPPTSVQLVALMKQAVCLAVVAGIAEMLYRYRNYQSDWLLIITGVVYASSVVWMNPGKGIVPAIYIFPILTSALSFNKRRIWAAYGLVLVCLTAIYLWIPELSRTLDLPQLAGVVFLYSGVALIATAITQSGHELMRNLQEAIEAKQELLVKTTIMDKLSKMDALTDLYNHKTFHEYLDRLIEYNERQGVPLHLAILDIDDFKTINDTYGHWVGDMILQRVASDIKQTITPDDFVARYGGEEFAVIFTGKTAEESYRLVEQIRHKLDSTSHTELDSRIVTASCGLCTYRTGMGRERLFKAADAALYNAKRAGKNRTVVTEEL